MNGHDHERMEGVLRGAVGALAGLLAMDLFMRGVKALQSDGGQPDQDEEPGPIERHDELDDISVVGDQAEEDESAPAAVGRIGYETVTGHDPDEETKERLGQAVHWGYGILLGGVYGALRVEEEGPDLLGGLGYGAAAWALGDELMVPLLGLSDGPTAHGWQQHATALGAHLVYGATTSAATQALKRVM